MFGALGVLGTLGLSGCVNQDFSAPIDVIHDFGDPSVLGANNMANPQVSVPAEGNSDEKMVGSISSDASSDASSNQTSPHPSQLIVERRWSYDAPQSSSNSTPKLEDKTQVVTKTPVRSIVKGELLSDDAGVLSIQTKSGEKVHSVVSGSVIYTGPSVQGSGKMVIVKSAEGILFAYSHLGSFSVSEGASLSKGDVIGVASDDPLVFQVRQSGSLLDGKKYIN